jgi:hypothetical protein
MCPRVETQTRQVYARKPFARLNKLEDGMEDEERKRKRWILANELVWSVSDGCGGGLGRGIVQDMVVQD